MKKPVIIVIAVSLIIIGVVATALVGHKPSKPSSDTPKNYDSINDESIGVSFNISKQFKPVPKQELVKLNPNYLYGFRHRVDKSVVCFVSQTPIVKQGVITAKYLKDGTFNAIKKNFPSAKLARWSVVNGRSAIFLDIIYTDQNKKIDQPEIVLVAKERTTFAFCQSLVTDSKKYSNDFTTFFSSLKVQ